MEKSSKEASRRIAPPGDKPSIWIDNEWPQLARKQIRPGIFAPKTAEASFPIFPGRNSFDLLLARKGYKVVILDVELDSLGPGLLSFGCSATSDARSSFRT
jgi:hypothetical protein